MATNDHDAVLDERIDNIVAWAKRCQIVLCQLKGIGPQGTWLGSRKLGPKSREYQWCAQVAAILAKLGIAAKTGGGDGLMEAPHYGCHLAERPDRAVAIRAEFLSTEETVNPYAGNGGMVVEMPDFASRKECLFVGSSFHIVLPGRLGTFDELYDLLDRLKHSQLGSAPVYFVERAGYWSKKMEFLIGFVDDELGPRISPSDYDLIRHIDLVETSPAAFAEMLLQDINWGGRTASVQVTAK